MANRFEPDKDPVQTVRLVWQIAEDMPDGKPFMIKKDYRASLHEKAALRKDLTAWRGRSFTFDELVGFDLENVIGAACMLNIVEKTSQKGKKFSNISSIMPLPKGMVRIESRDYQRVKDRPQQPPASKEPVPPAAENWAPHGEIDDDDVPF